MYVCAINRHYTPGLHVRSTDHVRTCLCYTVGPITNTIADFWQMVWEHKSTVIVMLTHLKEGDRVRMYVLECQNFQ